MMRFLSLLLAGAIGFAAPNKLPADFMQARTLYYEGADGNKEGYVQADKLFGKLFKQQPGDPKVQVYYGSLRLLEASHTWALWKKNSLSKQGIQLMDSAVAGAPENLEVHFVRAATTYALPAFFHRKQQAHDDFEFLAGRAANAARTGELEPRLAAASLYYHGLFLKEAANLKGAQAAWKQAIAIAPQSRAARESEQELKK